MDVFDNFESVSRSHQMKQLCRKQLAMIRSLQQERDGMMASMQNMMGAQPSDDQPV